MLIRKLFVGAELQLFAQKDKNTCLIPSPSFILHGHANVSSTQCVSV